MRTLRAGLLVLLLQLAAPWAIALNVAFVNPGRSNEAFWLASSQAMQSAADSLGIRLEVLYAEREPKRALEIAQEIAQRPAAKRPDYVILVNEKGTLVESAQALGAAGIKTFAAYSGLLPQERAQWAPRKGLPLLLGSLEPRARDAGYLTARALIQQGLAEKRLAADGKLHMLALAGDRSTPVSIQRNEGLRQALAENPQVELKEQAFGDWRRDLAKEKTQGLLQRYPEAQLLWAASDLMAFGALEALESRERKPGRDMLVSAINTSTEAMQARIDGRFAALAGGHFMTGAWALVMIYDHAQGRDFSDEGLELERPMFMLFSKPEATRFLSRFEGGIGKLDFRPYSKHLNLRLKQYQFGPGALLK
ncbi:ABC transporter substrate-binding protein [Roseateles oligotrophus]|uniref:ABC transporter substrate-binding protein n=1 Tax=Roseateles oligotrophus TaxID=1769250 RepID=A0ABT2Y8K9_9BURK|nr:ABC transporter substrate-binding protein [Roseateles oligotrophus]MCV2366629.1 ABC transporter substrate-binding protein [Roseateles oligotrophus]